MESFGGSRNRTQPETLGDILREALEEMAPRNEVRDGVLDVSVLSSEELKSVKGIEPGVILKRVDVPYLPDVRTANDPYIIAMRATIGSKVAINGKFLAIDKRQNPRLPTEEGYNNFEITGEDDKYIYLSAEKPDSKVIEIPELANRIESQGLGSIDFSVEGLEKGTVLKNVFLDAGVQILNFTLNDKSVFVEENVPNEEGNYDMEVIDISYADADSGGFVDLRVIAKSEVQSQAIEKAVDGALTSFEIGSVVENVTFKTTFGGNYICENPDGKALLLDKNSLSAASSIKDLVAGVPVNVKIIRDTKPGKPDGFYIVKLESDEKVGAKKEMVREKLKVVDGEVDLSDVDFSGQVTELNIDDIKEGTILSGLPPGMQDGALFINGKIVAFGGENILAGLLQVCDAKDEYFGLKPFNKEDALKNYFKVTDGEVDFANFSRDLFIGKSPNFTIEGFTKRTVLKNLFIPNNFNGFDIPFRVNGKLLYYEDPTPIPKAGFYDLVVELSVRGYYDLVLTSEARESFDSSERVTINESELAQRPEHESFFEHQVAALRNPSLQTALMQARIGIPEMSYGRELLSRTREMRGDEKEGERHRHFTAIGSAMFREKAAYRSFNAGIDVAVEHSSTRIREWLQNWEGPEPPRLPLAVLGSGPHGATFLSSFRMYNTEHDPLVVDQRQHIGGQFADAQEAVFRLNSRNRPQMKGDERDTRNLPGTEQTINPLGTMATLQVSDLSGEAYVTQDTLAYATRFNTVTSAEDFLTRCRLVAVTHRKRNDGSEIERCMFQDEVADSVYLIDVDELVIAGGIGRDVFNFAQEDYATEDFLKIERENAERGIRPTTMSFPQMVAWLGNPGNRSPLKGVKEAVVSGSGDSANVAVGILLGYEPGANRMPVSLDRVEKVYWIGQDIPSKEEWLKNIRTRYAQVGLEFPREQIEGYYSRIVPIADTRVENIYDSSRGENEQVGVVTSGGQTFNADLYVACNGFRNDLPGILSANNLEKVNRKDDSAGIEDDELRLFLKIGATFTSGNLALKIISLDTNKVEYLSTRLPYKEGTISECTKEDFTYVLDRLRRDSGSSAIEVKVPKSGARYEELFDEEGFAMGKRVAGTNITLVGPASELAVSDEEKQTAPVLELIPQNTAALFRYGRGTEKSARMVAKRLSAKSGTIYDSAPVEETLTLRKSNEVVTSSGNASIRTFRKPREMPFHIDHLEALKLSLADYFAQMEFPANLSEVELSVEIQTNANKGQRPLYSIKGLSVTNFSDADSEVRIEKWLGKIASDTIVAKAVESEATSYVKGKRGRDFLRESDIARKKAELATLTNERVIIQDENIRRVRDFSILTFQIPVRGSRADVTQLKQSWADVA